MTFDPLVGESLDHRVEAGEPRIEPKIPEPAKEESGHKHKVESFLLGAGSRWIPMLEALTIIDHERCCEPPRQKGGAHLRRRVVRSASGTEKRLDVSKIRSALDHQRQFGGHIEHILVHLGFADEEEIVHELTTHYGFPYIPMSHYELDSRVIPIVPVEVARHYCVIVIDKFNNVLTVAMANPLNSEAIKDIQRLTGCSVLAMVARASEIREKIEELYHRCDGPFDRI